MPLRTRDMRASFSALVMASALLSILALSGCTTISSVPDRASITTAYTVADNAELSSRYAPVIVSEHSERQYNKIGRPSARHDKYGNEEVFIDPAAAVYYLQQQKFSTARQSYTNLIYRVHFERVPFSLIPFNLTTGRNGGLLIVITLDQRQQPVLITTVHTCGCYLAIVPTNYLPAEAYPEHWDISGQKVYGMDLPGKLDFIDHNGSTIKPLLILQDATHRVMSIDIIDAATLAKDYRVVVASTEPIDMLKQLAIDGATTSFYHEDGWKKGYVKNDFKPFELLLMSWWVLDLNIGVDKEYGDHRETGTVFYTSMKPWQRQASDMWNFADFLRYWGWQI